MQVAVVVDGQVSLAPDDERSLRIHALPFSAELELERRRAHRRSGAHRVRGIRLAASSHCRYLEARMVAIEDPHDVSARRVDLRGCVIAVRAVDANDAVLVT